MRGAVARLGATRRKERLAVPKTMKAKSSIAGFLALNRTVRNSMSRRIALRRPKPEELQALLDEIEALDPAEEHKRIALQEEYDRKKRRTGIIPYIDPLDVRYRRFEAHPKAVLLGVLPGRKGAPKLRWFRTERPGRTVRGQSCAKSKPVRACSERNGGCLINDGSGRTDRGIRGDNG